MRVTLKLPEKFQSEMPTLNQNWFKKKANSIPTKSDNIPVESKLNVLKTTMHLLSERFYQKVGGRIVDSTQLGPKSATLMLIQNKPVQPVREVVTLMTERVTRTIIYHLI